MKGFEKNYVICIKSICSEDKEILDKSETKILKSKSPRMNSWGIQNIQRERHEKKKGKGLYKMSHFN